LEEVARGGANQERYRALTPWLLVGGAVCHMTYVLIASFVAPLWASGTLETWLAFADDQNVAVASTSDKVTMYVTLFLFYFCTYFVMVFFNAALTACAMKVVEGETPTIGYGLSMAGKRLRPSRRQALPTSSSRRCSTTTPRAGRSPPTLISLCSTRRSVPRRANG